MKLTEELVAYMAVAATGSTLINYQGKQIDLKPPWRRLSMTDAIKEYANTERCSRAKPPSENPEN